jgi:hypothetical protein
MLTHQLLSRAGDPVYLRFDDDAVAEFCGHVAATDSTKLFVLFGQRFWEHMAVLAKWVQESRQPLPGERGGGSMQYSTQRRGASAWQQAAAATVRSPHTLARA